MGDLLFAIANLSRKLGIDPESALRKANEKFTKRFTAMEERLHAQGRSVHEATLEEMEREWEAVKGTLARLRRATAGGHEDHEDHKGHKGTNRIHRTTRLEAVGISTFTLKLKMKPEPKIRAF